MHSGLGYGFNAGLIDPAGNLKLDLFTEATHSGLDPRQGHIVQHDPVNPGFDGFFKFFEIGDFALYLVGCVMLLDPFDRSGDPPRGADMILLEQDHIVKPKPVIETTTDLDGVFLKLAQTGSGLAGIEDLCLCAAGQLDEGMRLGRDAAQPLDEVQRGTFRLKDGRGSALDAHDLVLGLDLVPVLAIEGDLELGIDGLKNPARYLSSGDHAFGFGDHICHAVNGFQIKIGRRDIAGTDVLGKGLSDQVVDFHSFSPNKKEHLLTANALLGKSIVFFVLISVVNKHIIFLYPLWNDQI